MEKNRLNIGYQLLLSAVIIMTYLIRDIGLVLIPVLMTQLYFKVQKDENNPFNYLQESPSSYSLLNSLKSRCHFHLTR